MKADDTKTNGNVVAGLNAAGARRATLNYGILSNNALEWVGAATSDYR